MTFSIRKLNVLPVLFCVTVTGALLAQEPQSQSGDEPRGGWRKVSDQADGGPADQPSASQLPPADLPSRIDIPAGAFVTIRVNQPLSSDRNLAGDAFTATLAQPIIADGFVVARRGQTVAGRVAEAAKAGRRSGTSRLALELTEVTFADGRQVPVTSQLIEYHGGTSVGRDATAVATTSGIGAAIGGAAAGGAGAGIGAAAGAGAALIGVLTTRGRATEVYPEAMLTFRLTNPVTLSTERSAHAFQPVRQQDYEQPQRTLRTRPTTVYASDPYGYWGPGWGYGGWGWGGGWGGWYSRPYYWGGGPTFIIRGGGWGRGGGGWGRGGGRRR